MTKTPVQALFEAMSTVEGEFTISDMERMTAAVIAAARPQIEAEARANAVEAVKQFILGGRFLHDQAPGKLFAQEVTKAITNQGIGLAALPPTHQVVPSDLLQKIDIKAQAGLCYFTLESARVYLQEIRDLLAASKGEA